MERKVICKGKNLFLSAAAKFLPAMLVSIARFVLICVVPDSTYPKHKRSSPVATGSHRPSTILDEHWYLTRAI